MKKLILKKEVIVLLSDSELNSLRGGKEEKQTYDASNCVKTSCECPIDDGNPGSIGVVCGQQTDIYHCNDNSGRDFGCVETVYECL